MSGTPDYDKLLVMIAEVARYERDLKRGRDLIAAGEVLLNENLTKAFEAKQRLDKAIKEIINHKIGVVEPPLSGPGLVEVDTVMLSGRERTALLQILPDYLGIAGVAETDHTVSPDDEDIAVIIKLSERLKQTQPIEG